MSFHSDIEKLESNFLATEHAKAERLAQAGWVYGKIGHEKLPYWAYRKEIPGVGVCFVELDMAIKIERSLELYEENKKKQESAK